ncbi:CorA metal ion transporter [Coemansia sp. RSA 1822]|nr:CorA metal ion transporter [Coemansia sp. RSA 638]KAJ2564241.1 CorA metal ion transporter [Coemansia sp. RSA 1822]
MNSRSQQSGRRRGGYFGTMDTQTAMPPLDQGGLTGFNGVVFGSSGGSISGNINDLGSGVHESPVLQARAFSSHATDQVSVLQQEIRQLRRANHQLTCANDARTRAAVRMLGELTARNTEPAESDGVRRKQLMRLLLALLDPASIDPAADDQAADDQAADDSDAIDDGNSQLVEPEDTPLPPVCQSPPPLQPSSTMRSGRTRVLGLDNPPSRPASREATAKHGIDWDTSALREVASQGRVVRPNVSSDRYAAESRRAIGSSSMNNFGRQQNLSTPWRQDRRASRTSETSPHDAAFPKRQSEEPGCVGASGDESSEKLGALAVSLMNPNQFEQDAGSRFVLYSPSAGTFQAQTLDMLRRGSMTLADIIEASVRLVSLDQLQRDRIAEHEPAATSKAPHHTDIMSATSDSDGENALHITSVRSHTRERSPEPINNGGCFWLDITDPTPDEMASLARVFGIHPLTVEDIMTDDEGRDKFETFAGYNFIVYRTIDFGEDAQSNYEFNRGTEGIATANFCLVLKQSCVLSFHRTRGLCHVPNVVERLRDLVPSTTAMQVVTPAYVAYALIDDITDTLAPEMRSIELEVDAADELVLILSTNEQADMLQRIGAARRKILTLWRLLQGKPDVVRAFARLMDRHAMDEMARTDMDDLFEYPQPVDILTRASPSSTVYVPPTGLRRTTGSSAAVSQMGTSRRREPPLWPMHIGAYAKDRMATSSARASTSDLQPRMDTDVVTADEVSHYLSDVHDHLVTLVGSSSHCDMVLSRAHSNYLARLSLGLGESTVETNLFASRWTVIGAILVPLNVVTGLWGMNVKVPGQDGTDLRVFFQILGGCVGFVIIVIVWARYKKIF